ncbi:hypothetical protein [Ralstonia sp. Ralssp110]|uniref:hypothetical protein n=1 Tax=unclassified Ralstonia TaxID=209769 RepID=UPI0039B5A8F5
MIWHSGGWVRSAPSVAKPLKQTAAPTPDRAAKRELWLTRAWRRRADGASTLYAGDFRILVSFTGRSWSYNIETVKGEPASWSKSGFASLPDAKMATFDKITRLQRASA